MKFCPTNKLLNKLRQPLLIEWAKGKIIILGLKI